MNGPHPIAAALLEHADRQPQRPAIVCDDTVISYGTLKQRIGTTCRRLREWGVAPGDRVVLAATRSPTFVQVYFALHACGAIAVPVAPQIPAPRLSYILERTEAKLALVEQRVDQPGTQRKSLSVFEDENGARASMPWKPPAMDQPADLLFTSGTTGKPKGVLLTHANLAAAATNINTFIGNTADDSEALPLPLSHSFGLGRLRCNMLAGGSVVLCEGFLQIKKLFDSMQKWRTTGLASVPTGFAMLFRLSGDHIGRFAGQLKYIEIGSAPMSIDDKQRLMRLLPRTRICMHYGLTEASRAAFIEFHADAEALATIGKPSPNVSIEIRSEQGDPLPPGSEGEIWVRGGMVMKEYWRDEEATTRTLADGWLRTGDLGYRDGKGYIVLRGRTQDMINIGGLKVSPTEIEQALLAHPGVADCACVGVPDPQGVSGSVVRAFLVSRSGTTLLPAPAELAQFLRGKVEDYAIPVAFSWVEEIPKTSSGKIQRQQLLQGAT